MFQKQEVYSVLPCENKYKSKMYICEESIASQYRISLQYLIQKIINYERLKNVYKQKINLRAE